MTELNSIYRNFLWFVRSLIFSIYFILNRIYFSMPPHIHYAKSLQSQLTLFDPHGL